MPTYDNTNLKIVTSALDKNTIRPAKNRNREKKMWRSVGNVSIAHGRRHFLTPSAKNATNSCSLEWTVTLTRLGDLEVSSCPLPLQQGRRQGISKADHQAQETLVLELGDHNPHRLVGKQEGNSK